MNRSADMLTAALAAVDRGWYVFPLRPGSKKSALHGDTTERPCPRTGICRDGHRKWEQRAMNDPDQVRWYWTSDRYAGCNVAIATGPSQLLVVDLDLPKSPRDVPPESYSRRGIRDGLGMFAAVCADAGQPVPDDTYTVRSARDGRHHYYQAPEGVRLGITEGEQGNGLGWKVDTRGWGGYVVAPGSITPDGRYDVIRDLPVMDSPGWLVHRLAPKPSTAITAPRQIAVDRLPAYLAAVVRRECERVSTAPPGHGRALFVAGLNLGQFVGADVLPPAVAEQALYTTAVSLINSGCGCTEREVLRAIRNGIKVGATRPRALPATGRVA